MGDHATAIADLGAELEELETMRRASRVTERGACDWPELRRAILAHGGIGPSVDWSRDWYPADLYRANGCAPDVVAVEIASAPWASEGAGNDAAMFTYLQRSWAQWQRFNASAPHRVVKTPAAPALKPGERRFADLVSELQRKHGTTVDLALLRSEWVSAYETGERVTVTVNGREYRGTIGATRGPLPRFVLLTSLPL